jgi:hypothetical protein
MGAGHDVSATHEEFATKRFCLAQRETDGTSCRVRLATQHALSVSGLPPPFFVTEAAKQTPVTENAMNPPVSAPAIKNALFEVSSCSYQSHRK